MEVLEERLGALSIARRSRPAEPTYLLDVALQPSPGHALAVCCSDFSVHLHNKETLRLLGTYNGHKGPICRIAFTHRSLNVLYSASADGTVRLWDVRCPGKESTQIFKSDDCHSFCSFDLSCNDSLLCAGTEQINNEDSFLVFWDSRKPGGALLGVYSESHSDDITQVCFHPSDKDRMASGSTDGLVNVFDLKKGAEEEALVATCNSESSASAICWTGEGYRQLLCLSHDEGLHLWDLGQLDTERTLTVYSCSDARSSISSSTGESAVDFLVGGRWLEAERRLLVLGGRSAGDVQLLTCDGDGLRLVRTLRDGHSSTVRCFEWDATEQSLFTAGEDAQLLRWTPGGDELKDGKRETMKSESALRLKTRPHKKHNFSRDKKM